MATSADTFRNEGASLWTPGRAFTARVRNCGWKCSSVETPPMKLDDGSKPSGGRVKALCSFWNRPVNVTDRKSTRLNSSHLVISYAVFCLKKKKKKNNTY